MEECMQMIPVWVWHLFFWDAIWKIIAFWKSARNNHLVWFIFIAITNTVGILPIIYILTHRRSNQVTPTLNQR